MTSLTPAQAATLRRLTDPYPTEAHRGTGTLPAALHSLAVTGLADVFHDHTRAEEPWTARITQDGRDALAAAPTEEPDWDALADRAHDRRQAAIVDALIAARPQPEDVTTVREYALPTPVVIDHPYRHLERVVAFRVRVSVTRFPHDPFEDTETRVEVYAQTATRTGHPNARARRDWITAPDTLAAMLPREEVTIA